MMSEEAQKSFANSFGLMSMELFKNQQRNADKQGGSIYTEEMK